MSREGAGSGAQRHGPNTWRAATAVGIGLVAAAVLTACSSGSEPVLTTTPSITPAGKKYEFSAAQVPKNQWPNPCALLTTSSAEAAIGGQVAVRRFHEQCIYQPRSAVYPTVSVNLEAVGTDAGAAYADARELNRSLHPRSVAGVGRAANQHPLRHIPASVLEVDAGDAYFTVIAQSPYHESPSATQIRTLLVQVGRVVADEFTG